MVINSTHNLLFLLLLLLLSNLLTFLLFSSPSCPSIPSQPSPPSLPPEFLTFTSPQPLPFGHNPNFDSSTLHPPVGHSCTLFLPDLLRFSSYPINGSCPDDELLSQKLLLRGCEPLPRRRCRPPSPPNFPEPSPLPLSLWSTPPDSSIHWSSYSCKSFSCLIARKHLPNFDDCKDCFDLSGRELSRWVTPSTNPLDFTIDSVLSSKPPGTIRIGLDIGGGSGTFAVRMLERNVTIVTTSMNLNGPFNSFIAARGVVPLYVSVSQRLPFFDNTLDIVHSMHVLSNWIPTTLLHFIMFDVYRVLRPGGVFWLDHFFFVEDQMEVYVGVIESVGFEKVKWVVGRKLDRGPEIREMYISALLEKPLKNSW
ncbi:uncharacterized protein LOC120282555 [Dioscorea cayenensis subsp. rotundata]|uniref:Uncharacterized protein LOC120282555 n=1 Tax=Dioscorea cayennensis subsp. rotundata TaxID=55577 RepID=A0AB40D2J5_DIOCR|nr:uncharacterized protein LOC120282555 [Dioscorea cayenensis subsp. rotundata]